MITITLEGECWRDILREMSIIQNAARGSGSETDYKKSVCPACGKPASTFDNEEHRWVGMNRKEYCCVDCSIAGPSASRTEAKPEQTDIAKAYEKCPESVLNRLRWVLGEYFLGPEERAEILERVRQ